ncbi:MAG TPA: alpha/beta fold hydrolase [Candidatus Acidoferrales bacterium]|nr:alpha/beta fold hydrolase [Candidatus Acidoferrales bacterium]
MTVALLFAAPLFAPAHAQDGAIERELHWVVTREKFELAIERLRATQNRDTQPLVILSHGLLVNSAFLNLDDEHSFARYLARAGFDVWNLSFRGTGRSLAPLKNPPKRWDLDAFIEQDIPQVIRFVVKESKKPRAAWVGYELGGMLLYGYLAQKKDPAIAALVTIAAPLTFAEPEQKPIKNLLELNDRPTLKNFLLYLNAPFLMRLALPVIPKLERLFYNPDNLDPQTKEKLLEEALADINPGVLDHLLLMIEREEMVSARNGFRYREHLKRIQLPVLLVGGGDDSLAPPKALQQIHARLGSADRTLRIFGGKSRRETSYGHFDLILGRDAKKEVFPFIGQWLKKKLTQR